MIGFWLVALIAALHVWILVLEMFLWETPMARRAFGTSAEFAANTRVLAANQGLYNGFLAAGLIWALILGLPGAGWDASGLRGSMAGRPPPGGSYMCRRCRRPWPCWRCCWSFEKISGPMPSAC
jgi:Protein of unknown function (DUF1304)